MTKPALAVALLVVMAGAWHFALRPAVAPLAISARAPAATTARVATAVPTVRLEKLVAAGIPAPGAWRNPFTTGPAASATSAPPGLSTRQTGPAPAGSEAPVAPAWPRVALIGVAEAREGGGLVRTAIVSGPHGVHHARPGDVIEQVYRVERIGGDGVDLQLLPEGRTVRLALRP